MKLDHMEPAIEMLSEIKILSKLLKIRIKDKVINENLLSTLTLQESIAYLMHTDKALQKIVTELTHAINLLDEHLDYFIPTTKMWAQLTSI